MKTSPFQIKETAAHPLTSAGPSIQGKGATPPAFSVTAAPPAVQKTEKDKETGAEDTIQARFQPDKERKPRTRLKIGQPNDKYEQEADAVAKKAISTPDEAIQTVQKKPLDVSGAQPGISMKASPTRFQAPRTISPSLQPKIQRFAAENEAEQVSETGDSIFQLKSKGEPVPPPDAPETPPSDAGSSNLDTTLVQSKGGGATLPQGTQDFMGPRIGADFSGVKVHTGEQAVQMNQQLGSKAFAHGKDVYFNKGQYNPESSSGKELLAHELTHTVQQGGAPVKTKQDFGTTETPQIQQKTTSGIVQKRAMNHIEGGQDPEVDKARKKSTILRTIAGWAKAIPGYTLLTYVIGREPILGERVKRSGTNLVGGIMGIVPGGNALFEKLKESGALDKAYSWVSQHLFQANLTWTRIYGDLTNFYNSLNWTDALSPGSVWKRAKKIITGFYSDVKAFSGKAGKKIMELTFAGFAGAGGAAVITWLMKLGKNVFKIFKNPILFFKHLGGAVKGGISGFMSKIGDHLKNGFMEWLMGAMKGTGIELPQEWNLKSTFKFLLEVAGITYEKIRVRLVKRFGEKTISRAERTVNFFKRFMKEGPIILWKFLKEKAFAIKETIMNAVKDWALGAIIKAGIKNLLTMLVPAGIIGKAIEFMVKFVKWILDNKEKIKSIVDSIFQSLNDIVLGNTKAGAGLIESALTKSVPALLDMLAKLMGLTGLAQTVQSTIKGLKAKLDAGMEKAFDWLEGKLEKWSGVKPKNLDDNTDTKEAQQKGKNSLNTVPPHIQSKINVKLPPFPVMMQKQKHHLHTEVKSGHLQPVIMRSDPVDLRAAIEEVIQKLKAIPGTTPQRGVAIKKLNEIKTKFEDGYLSKQCKNRINDFLKGSRLQGKRGSLAAEEGLNERKKELLFLIISEIRAELNEYMAEIGTNISHIAHTLNITDLTDITEAPIHKQRYLPFNGKLPGNWIRQKIYDEALGYPWEEKRKFITERDLPIIAKRVKLAQKNDDHSDWEKMKKEGWIQEKADIKNYNPKDQSVEYAVDHDTPLVELWNRSGFNTNDSEREEHHLDDDNLQLVEKKWNLKKGGNDQHYKKYVGPKFRSIIAEGGVENASTILGKFFLDAPGGSKIKTINKK